jgi:predicted permease
MRELLRRIAYFVRHGRMMDELAEELDFHRAMKEREVEGDGLTQAAARQEAQRALGNDLLARERARDAWMAPALQDLARDFRLAVRLAVKDRGFTAVAALTLGLGIAANTTIFTVVNAMVLRGLPVAQPDRIVSLNGVREQARRPIAVSYRDVEDWRAAGVTGIAAYGGGSATLDDDGVAPDVFAMAYISGNSFDLLGQRPALGRTFLDADDRPGAAPVVILGHRIWIERYQGDPFIIDRAIRVNGTTATVVGVMPAGFRFPQVHDVWQPLAAMPRLVVDKRNARTLNAFARLAPGVPIMQAQAQLDAIAGRLAREHLETNRDFRPQLVPFTGTADHPIFIALFGATGFLLLIACVNVANLQLVRAARRMRELCIRASIGASRWRIVRQLLAESLLLAAVAGVLAMMLSAAMIGWFSNMVEGINFPYWYRDRWTMDGRVFAYGASLCLATAIVFGLLPAIRLWRSDLSLGLRDGGRSTTAGPGARQWTTGLLAGQLTFTVVLLGGAGLMLRSLVALIDADRVISTRGLFRVSLRLPETRYQAWPDRQQLYERIEESLAGAPPIAFASFATSSPFIGAPGDWRLATEAQRDVGARDLPSVMLLGVGIRYFDTIGLGLVRGRPFESRDGTDGHDNAIINQRLAAMFFGGENPIGRRIRLVSPTGGAPDFTATIVAVSRTVRQNFLEDLAPVVYVPYKARQLPGAQFLIRARDGDASALSALRAQLAAIDRDIVPFNITPASLDVTQSRWGNTVFGSMIAMSAGIALLLSAIGLYAVTASGVTQRTQEIGVRMALGARAFSVIWLVVRRAVAPVVVGLTLGLTGALGAARLIRGMLVQTSPDDPMTFAGIAGLLVIVALAACVWPARRAATLDPVAALRAE